MTIDTEKERALQAEFERRMNEAEGGHRSRIAGRLRDQVSKTLTEAGSLGSSKDAVEIRDLLRTARAQLHRMEREP